MAGRQSILSTDGKTAVELEEILQQYIQLNGVPKTKKKLIKGRCSQATTTETFVKETLSL